MISIENEQLAVNVNFKGAEISSLKNKSNDQELIWQADPKHWARHAPILFPIVGRLKNEEYRYLGDRYSLSQHGFARDLEFQVESSDDTSCKLSLSHSRETRLGYPFKFKLIIEYQLEGLKLKTLYQVQNLDNHDMFFSLGAHPAFNCEINSEVKRSDYQLIFEQNENLKSQLLENGLRSGDEIEIFNDSNRIKIADDLFDRDALIFHDLKSSAVSLARQDQKIITVHFKGFPYLGIWSKSANSNFVCIEPWYGVADKSDHTSDLKEKEGIISLAPKNSFETELIFEIH